jgi:long-subunit fatty acid transport protein
MLHKLIHKLTLSFAFTLLFFSFSLKAQFITSSPYSSYGFGEPYFPGLAYNTGFGFAGAALDSNYHVNIINPAALSSLQLATLEGSVVTRQMFYQDANGQSFKWNTSLDHVVFGLPLKKRSGISFGLTPYSGIGVNQSDTIETNGFGKINFTNLDSGGLNKGFAAFGFAVKSFSFGIEASYVFGNIKRQRELILIDDPLASNINRTVRTGLGGIQSKFGVHYKTKLNSKTRLSLGASYKPGSFLNGKSSLQTITFNLSSSNVRSGSKIVEDVADIKGKLYDPQSGTFGFAVYRGSKWVYAADVNYSQMSAFKAFLPKDTIIENGEELFSGADSLTDSWRISGGVQYTPDTSSLKFFMRSQYRAGAYYKKQGVRVNGVDIMEYGVSLGWGLPLKRVYRDRIPSAEVAVVFGERGSLENMLTKERFITARIGLTISDRWFIKRKFD